MATTALEALQNAQMNFLYAARVIPALQSNLNWNFGVQQLENAVTALENGLDPHDEIQEHMFGEVNTSKEQSPSPRPTRHTHSPPSVVIDGGGGLNRKAVMHCLIVTLEWENAMYLVDHPGSPYTVEREDDRRAAAYCVDITQRCTCPELAWLDVRCWCEFDLDEPPKVCIALSEDAGLGDNDGEYTLAELDAGKHWDDLNRLCFHSWFKVVDLAQGRK